MGPKKGTKKDAGRRAPTKKAVKTTCPIREAKIKSMSLHRCERLPEEQYIAAIEEARNCQQSGAEYKLSLKAAGLAPATIDRYHGCMDAVKKFVCTMQDLPQGTDIGWFNEDDWWCFVRMHLGRGLQATTMANYLNALIFYQTTTRSGLGPGEACWTHEKSIRDAIKCAGFNNKERKPIRGAVNAAMTEQYVGQGCNAGNDPGKTWLTVVPVLVHVSTLRCCCEARVKVVVVESGLSR